MYLDISGLVRVQCRDLPADIEAALHNTFPQFVKKGEVDRPHMLVEAVASWDERELEIANQKNIQPCWLTLDSSGEAAVIYGFRGRLDMVLRTGDPLRIQIKPRAKAANKFMDVFYLALTIALARKRPLLFKGALVVRDGRPLVLTGMSGAGKTTLLLHLLHEGWDYLSDNTFLYSEGEAQLFRRKVVYNYFHAQQFQELFTNYEDHAVELRKAGRKIRMRELALRHLPAFAHQIGKLKQWTDPYLVRDPKQLFPNCKVLTHATPKLFLLLKPGTKIVFRELEREEVLARFKVMHELSWEALHQLDMTAELSTGKPLFDFNETLAANLGEAFTYEVSVPAARDFEPVYAELRRELDRLLEKVYG